jgi:2-dehydro-3-deoxyphosphogluconate aldolase/(4S)-4-hydroxy-2-oxoglutarate aldolase
MSKKQEILARLKSSGVVAVVRTDQPGDLIEVGRALAKGGVSFLEITMTVPKALAIIEQVADALKEEVVVGAGTVLDAETARAVILAGAGYVVSPAMRPAVIEVCRRYDVVCMPGGMTPTEVLEAWELGADVVKVFPGSVGGPQFLKHLKGPFPFIELMTTGTVNLDNAAQFIKAGACAVGIGGELVGNQAIAGREFDRITQNARAFIQIVKNAQALQP